MGLPITVGIPLTISRTALFEELVIPSIQANRPSEILVDDSAEHANVKRNRLVKKARYPYVLLCDDDVILAQNALELFHKALVAESDNVGWAYSDFFTIGHPTRHHDYHKAGPWDAPRLLRENYISMISLLRRSAYQKMDEKLGRFQDWDLWLTMFKQGYRGVYVPKTLFAAIYNGDGITQREGKREAMQVVQRKHGIIA